MYNFDIAAESQLIAGRIHDYYSIPEQAAGKKAVAGPKSIDPRMSWRERT